MIAQFLHNQPVHPAALRFVMQPTINIALRATREAAAALTRYSERPDRIRILDENAGRAITNAHRDAEQAMLYQLQKVFPDHCYRSTISDPIKGADESTTWLINPLDGINNLQHGLAAWTTAIACKTQGNIQHAIIYVPVLEEEFIASRGIGASLNNHRIRVSGAVELENSLLAFDSRTVIDEFETFQQLAEAARSNRAQLRISGCHTLDLAYVAAGRFDAGFHSWSDPVALSASQLLLQEAGGLLSDSLGNPQPAAESGLAFGNPRCFKQLLKYLRPAS